MRKKVQNTHSIKTKYILAILGSLLFSTINIYLFINYNPNFKTRSAPVMAKLNLKKNDVKRKLSDSLSWSRPNLGEELFKGDEIFTGEESIAIIYLTKEKIQLTLSPNSLVKVEYNEKKPLIEIKKGEAEIAGPNKIDLDLKTEGQILKVNADENSNFKITNSGNSVGIKSLTGNISINNSKIIPKIINTFNKQTGQIKADTRPEIKNPTEDQIIFQEKKNVFPNVKHNSNTERIVFEIAQDKYFEKIISTQLMESPTPLNNLAVGDYYIRIQSQDKLGTPIHFQVKNNILFKNLTPIDNSKLLIQRGRSLHFSWTSFDGVSTKIIITHLESNQSYSLNTENSSIDFIPKLDGTYKWKLEGKYKNFEIRPGLENHFSLNFEQMSNLLEPIQNKIPLPTKRQLNFAWNGWPKEIFNLKIINKSTNTEVINENNENTKYIWNNIQPGDYVFILTPQVFLSEKEKSFSFPFIVQKPLLTWKNITKIESMDQNPIYLIPIKEILYKSESYFDVFYNKRPISSRLLLTTKSKIQLTKDGIYCIKPYLKNKNDYFFDPDPLCFSYKYVDPFPDIPKASDQILTLNELQDHNSYVLKCPIVKRAKSYHFIISKDKEGQFVIYDKKSNSNELTWKTNRSGVYYLKYKAIDDAGRISTASPISKLIFPISPLDKIE
jgi:hypothetical protein